MARKTEIMNHLGEVVHPITSEECVIFNDGQNLDDKISSLQTKMYTPTVECSSPMFKVGQGDKVDYSGNVVDGAYESCVLKGRTLVNCIQEPSSQDVVLPYEFSEGQRVTINDTKESGALGVELKGQTLVNLCTINNFRHDGGASVTVTNTGSSIKVVCDTSGSRVVSFKLNQTLKSNTKYMLVAKQTKSFNSETPLPTLSFFNGITFVNDWATPSDSGKTIIATTDASLYTHITFGVHGYMAQGDTYELSYPVLLEYQEGMENWDIPYFEGMCDVKMPILTTTGKNLFEGEFVLGEWNGIRIIESLNRLASSKLIEVRGGSTLTLSSQVYQIRMLTFLDENKKWIGHSVLNDSNTLTAKTPNNCKYIGFNLRKSDNTNFTEDEIKINSNVMVEYGTQATPFEPYKTSILSLPEEVVLRSLPNGVCDTYNVNTGVYIQRVGEIVLNGQSDIVWNGSSYGSETHHAFYTRSVENVKNNMAKPYCDSLPSNANLGECQLDREGCITNTDSQGWGNIWIKLSNQKIANDVSSLNTYLQSNPITVQYELINPIITKINSSSPLKPWGTTTHIYSKIPASTLYPIFSHSNPTYPVILKPSTKYSIIANSYSNGHTDSIINLSLGGTTTSTTVGSHATTIATPSTLGNELLTMSGCGNKLNNVMVIEGDVVGDESYFEGICDSKSPILSNVGKNLFNGNWDNTPPSAIYTTDFIRVEPLSQYVINILAQLKGSSIQFFDENKKMIEQKDHITALTTQETRYIKWKVRLIGDISPIGLDVQIEKNAKFTTYEPYKSNILSCETYYDEATQSDKTIVLRSLPNGVCDTLDVESGEYVQRIGEVVLDGSENWILNNSKINTIQFHCRDPFDMASCSNSNIYNLTCSTLMALSANNCYMGEDEGISINDKAKLEINIFKTKLSTQDVNGFKQWLSQNPTIVQYELATPITRKVDLSGFPYSYKDGHVILESGSIEQSLTPKVEYSCTTNRTGVLETTTKRIAKHEQEINDIEALVIANLVNSDYQSTLLSFNMELVL